jgi:hypothetical protein
MKVYNVEGHILDIEIVSDAVTKDDIMKIEDVMVEMLKQYDKIAIRVALGRHLEMTIKAQLEVLKAGIKMHSQIDRLVVIGDRQILKLLTSLDNVFTPWKERYFSIDELEEANLWLKA